MNEVEVIRAEPHRERFAPRGSVPATLLTWAVGIIVALGVPGVGAWIAHSERITATETQIQGIEKNYEQIMRKLNEIEKHLRTK